MRKILALLALLLLAAPAPATVNTTASFITYQGNGATTVWSFTFPAVAAGDLVVQTVTAGVTTTVSPSLYTVTLNPAIAPNPTAAGGTITYPLVGSPLAIGTTITISRVLPVIQGTSLNNQGTLYPSVLEQAYDYVTMLTQQSNSSVLRAIVGPSTDPNGLNYTLPSAAQRANTALIFDGSGNVTTGTIPSSGTISSAMQPVVSAASLSAGRTAFGLGSMAVENINGGSCGGASLQDDGSGNARVVLTTVSDAVNQSVTCAYHLTQRVATGPIIYTLARANTLFNGFGFWVYALPTGSAITITPNANDNFDGVASGTSVTLNPGTWAFIWTNAASSGTWHLTGSQAQAVVATDGTGCARPSLTTRVASCRTTTVTGFSHDFEAGSHIAFTGATGEYGTYSDDIVMTAAMGVTALFYYNSFTTPVFSGPGTLEEMGYFHWAPQVTGGHVDTIYGLNFKEAVVSGGASIDAQYAIFCPALAAATLNRCAFFAGDSEFRGHLHASGASPVLTSCGTTPSIIGNDQAGVIVTGTGSPTGCTLTFVESFLQTPSCVLSWASGPLASMGWTTNLTNIAITQTGANNTRIHYHCWDTL